jgi:HSP20 family protein
MANNNLTKMVTHPLASLHQEVDKLFGSFFGDLSFPHLKNGQILPKIDLKETSERYLLDAELPGVPAEDVEVSVANGVLTVKGEHKAEKEEKDKNYLRVERSYGQFERSINLPEDADDSKISAKSKDGVLTITIPKKPGAKPETRKIEVKAA